MTRARFVLGDDGAAASASTRVREAVITAPRDRDALKAEIVAMREKVRAAHPVKADRFDVKHSAGGMVDAEFAVQFLVLSQSAAHPELVPNVGNIALLQRAEAGRPAARRASARRRPPAYRELRRVQHRARLNEEPTQVPMSSLRGRARGDAGPVEGGVWLSGRVAANAASRCSRARRCCSWRAAPADRAAAPASDATAPTPIRPPGLGQVPDAEPRVEPIRSSGGTSKPYVVLGRVLRADHRRPAVPRERPGVLVRPQVPRPVAPRAASPTTCTR